MSEEAEVAVVGAGVAGAAACIALARQGLRPCWIAPISDAQDEPIGESLAPAAQPILASLGLSNLLHNPCHRRANSVFSSWGTTRLMERNASVQLQGPGHVIDRPIFQADLCAAAAKVAEQSPFLLNSVELDPAGAAWRLRLSDGSHRTARFIVDASGRGAVVGRRHACLRRADNLAAATVVLSQSDSRVQPTSATLIETVAEGWWYAALLADGRLALAYFSDPDLLPRGVSRDPAVWRQLLEQTVYINRWVEEAGFSGEQAPRLRSAGTTWLESPCGIQDGGAAWAAIGDAAAAFDPLSSHGMTTALWSAEQVGRLAPATLAGDGRALNHYAEKMRQGRQRYMNERQALYAAESRFTEATFWRRRKA